MILGNQVAVHLECLLLAMDVLLLSPLDVESSVKNAAPQRLDWQPGIRHRADCPILIERWSLRTVIPGRTMNRID